MVMATREEIRDIIVRMHTAETLEEGFKDVSDDVVVEDWTLGTGEKVVGKKALLEQIIRPSDRAFPNENFEFKYLVISESDGMVVLDSTFSADFVRDYKGIAAHGGRVSWPIRDMFQVESGKIVRMWYASDTSAMYSSLKGDRT